MPKFKRIWGGFGEGFERILEGLGKDLGRFGRILKDLGTLGVLGLFWGSFLGFLHVFSSILCNFTCFGPVRLRVGGFEPLDVSKTIIWPMLRLLEPFFRVFFSHRFSSLGLHAATVLIIFRSSRSLLRQVEFWPTFWHVFLAISF